MRGKHEVVFDKEKSVFKPWVKDSPKIVRAALTADLDYWKCKKFIRDPDDLAQVTAVISLNFAHLKLIWMTLISAENYPHIGMTMFSAWCREVDILDNSIPTSTVDRMFIATKVGSPPGASNQQLFRHEFLEILVRVANAKYRDTGRANTYIDCLNLLMKDVLTKFSPRPW